MYRSSFLWSYSVQKEKRSGTKTVTPSVRLYSQKSANTIRIYVREKKECGKSRTRIEPLFFVYMFLRGGANASDRGRGKRVVRKT